ncbi:DNA cross-link repair protein pso2/snm1 [Pisolithus thermaeus]|nr:DNA cross-link repair protein pso2/snm1 [Pisolithus thermaeus]
MAPARKRKEAPQHNSLLHFFSHPSPAKRGRASHVAPANAKNTVEVIVIDSDDEDDTAHVGKPQVKITASKVGDDAVSSSGYSPRGFSGQADGKQRIEENHHSTLTFGKPSMLLQEGDYPAKDSTTSVLPFDAPDPHPSCDSQESLLCTFGIANSLLRSPLNETSLCEDESEGPSHEKVSVDDDLHGSQQPKPSTSQTYDAQCSAVLIENQEWNTGDDEHVATVWGETICKDDSDEIQLSEICPVCNRELSGMSELELQYHVNECLDLTIPSNDSFQQSNPNQAQSSSEKHVNQRSYNDAFSLLMTSCKDIDAWNEVDTTENTHKLPGQGGRRRAPFYKVLQGMPIAVDAFRYGAIPGITAYFLTHAHSDHYTSLASSWKNGPIYCSEVTANLVIHMLSVDPKWVHALPMDTPTAIPDTGGVLVTLIDANHCPGSCLFLFEGPQTVHAGDSAFRSSSVGSSKVFRYLHCGDFRASPRHVLHPAIKGKPIDHIYMDTTYLNPKYVFPPQAQVVDACAELARRIAAGEFIRPADANGKRDSTIETWVNGNSGCESTESKLPQARTLIVVGTYSVGKERIVKAVAQALQTKVYCDPRKAAILRCQNDQHLDDLITSDPLEGGVHLLPLGLVASDKLKSYVQRFKGTFSRVVGFRPTGWTYIPPAGSNSSLAIQTIISRSQASMFTYNDLQPSQKSSYDVQLFGVPYSEHSSFLELTCFAISCDWAKIIPTVNVENKRTRVKMAQWIECWAAEKKRGKVLVQPRTDDYW